MSDRIRFNPGSPRLGVGPTTVVPIGTKETAAERARRLIEMQGFTGLSDEEIREIGPWLRLAPGVSIVWTAVATAAGSAAALWALVPLSALGALLPTHPFDVVYNHGLRFALGTRPIPRYGAPRRFGWVLAALFLAAAATAFQFGVTTIAYVFSAVFVVGATGTVTTGFCLAAWIWQTLFAARFGTGRPAGQSRG